MTEISAFNTFRDLRTIFSLYADSYIVDPMYEIFVNTNVPASIPLCYE